MAAACLMLSKELKLSSIKLIGAVFGPWHLMLLMASVSLAVAARAIWDELKRLVK